MKNNNNSNRLIAVRQALSFSQREMAEELGVVHGAVGLWEGGKRRIPGPVIKLIELYEEELGLAENRQKVEPLEKIESTWLARTIKLCNTGVQLSGKYVMAGLRDVLQSDDGANRIRSQTQAAIAKQIVHTFGTLKGLPHKLGQILSYMDVDATADVRRIYATLQDLTPPMTGAMVADCIVREFRKTPNQLFAKWSEKPFAAASIGQVHRATTHDGQVVAVKVQYPRIREIIQADLKNASVLDRLAGILVRQYESGNLVEELAERFLDECDYTLEARQQMLMRQHHAKNPRILIPQVHADLSSKAVLTMDYVEGERFADFQRRAGQAEKNRAAAVIWDYACQSMLQHRLFNTDPHPGNYLFTKDAVAFLDYGCVKSIPSATHKPWKKFLWGVAHHQKEVVKEAVHAMNIVSNPRKFDFEIFYELMQEWYYPCYCNKPFTFTREFLAARKNSGEKFAKIGKVCLPKEHLFLNQLQWGLYAVLADLNATNNWSERYLPHIE